MTTIEKNLANILSEQKDKIIDLWRAKLILDSKTLVEAIGVKKMDQMSGDILDAIIQVIPDSTDILSGSYEKVHKNLESVGKEFSQNNFTTSQTAEFLFSLKNAVIPILQKESNSDTHLVDLIYMWSNAIASLGLYIFEAFLNSKEKLIREQQSVFMEMSVPVVKIWDKILLIPLVGMLDSTRTQLMMETMLTSIEETQSKIAILDISGIPIVDSLVARHLITTATAARLMGAECLITGIRPKIAQTLVQLRVDLCGFKTHTTLSDGLKLALELTGQTIK